VRGKISQEAPSGAGLEFNLLSVILAVFSIVLAIDTGQKIKLLVKGGESARYKY